jgi:quercetin dioxygenase-like cupin family protein
VRWLISDEDGAPNFYMRRFEIAPGGATPHHRHPWEHEVYVIEGAGAVVTPDVEEPIRAGDVVYMPPDEEHHFAGDEKSGVVLLCLIPKEGKK